MVPPNGYKRLEQFEIYSVGSLTQQKPEVVEEKKIKSAGYALSGETRSNVLLGLHVPKLGWVPPMTAGTNFPHHQYNANTSPRTQILRRRAQRSAQQMSVKLAKFPAIVLTNY